MPIITSGLSSLATGIKDVRSERLKYSERLASGGAEAPWSSKSASQIDVSISTTNQIARLEGFEKGNKLVESRLRTQLMAIDSYMQLAREIHTEFMPGRHALGEARPGLAATQQSIVDKFRQIGGRINSVSGEYAMAGVATQDPPIKADWDEFPEIGAGDGAVVDREFAAAEYSEPVDGSITVYINDMGDTVSLSGSSFDAEVVNLYGAIVNLCNSRTGADEASAQASAIAANAHQALLSKYYQKLNELNMVAEQDDQLSSLIQQAISLREETTEDNIEGLLSKVTTLSVIEEIRQHLFTQASRKAQDAAEMLRRG